jgi:hypothetical protein
MRPQLFLPLLLISCTKIEPSSMTEPSANKTAPKEAKEKPFTPPPLSSLPDLGVKKAEPLGKPIAALKKYCPGPKKNGDAPIACKCLPVGGSSGEESWDDAAASCAAPTIELIPSLSNVQLLGRQSTGPIDKETGEQDISANFSLIFQADKILYEYNVGTSTMVPAMGYASNYTLEKMEFTDAIEGGEKELIAVLTSSGKNYDVNPPALTADGSVVICGQGASKKMSCLTFALGAGKGANYELKYTFEKGRLYLVETSAKTSPDIKTLSGAYTLEFP